MKITIIISYFTINTLPINKKVGSKHSSSIFIKQQQLLIYCTQHPAFYIPKVYINIILGKFKEYSRQVVIYIIQMKQTRNLKQSHKLLIFSKIKSNIIQDESRLDDIH